MPRPTLSAVQALPPDRTETGLPQLATPREIASALRVSVQSVYSWIRRGQLRAVKLGGCVRVRVADVRLFLESRG